MRNRKENHSKDELFVLQMTKLQFENELKSFVSGPTPSNLIDWRVLRRRRTEQERKQLPDMELEHLNWELISNVTEADSIKLTRDPFRGLALELKEKETGLWIVVSTEGDRDSITVVEKEGFRHVGFKQIQVNPKARNDLRAWLKSKQKTSTAKTTKINTKRVAAKNKKPDSSFPRLSGLFLLSAMIVSVALSLFVYLKINNLVVTGFILFSAMLIFLLLGTFKLRQEKSLSEKNFIQLMKLVVEQIPHLIRDIDKHKNR